MNNVTLMVKTFLRPHLLERLHNSIRNYYADIPVIILNDDKNPINIVHKNTTVINHQEFNIGVSIGRNIMIDKITTKYFVLLDDDFIFTPDTKLDNALSEIEMCDCDILGGTVIENGRKLTYHGDIFFTDDAIISKYKHHSDGIMKLDLIPNFFIAKTESIKKIKWDGELKTCEHSDFFVRCKLENVDVRVTNSFSIVHLPEKLNEYAKYRNDTQQYTNIFLNKFDKQKYIACSGAVYYKR